MDCLSMDALTSLLLFVFCGANHPKKIFLIYFTEFVFEGLNFEGIDPYPILLTLYDGIHHTS